MTRGEEIALNAMKKEHKSLSRRADLAKNKTTECINAASTILKIRMEASEILKSDKSHDEQMKLINVLANKEKSAFKAGKLNMVKLMDKEHELMFACDDLQREISMIEFRHSMRKSA
jgi:hypothetical protein